MNNWTINLTDKFIWREGVTITDSEDNVICDINMDNPIYHKNANLIANAPRMLELIQDLAENLEFQLAKTGYCGPGDHKDKKSDNDTFGGHDLLNRVNNLIKEL